MERAKCVWVESSWDGIIPALQAKKIDAIASSMMFIPKRMEQIAFTNKVSNAPSRLVVRRGSPLQPTAASLKGKRIGVEQGSSQEAYAKAMWAPAGVEIVSYQNQDLVYNDLVSGRLDASFQSSIQANSGFLKKPIGKGLCFRRSGVRSQVLRGGRENPSCFWQATAHCCWTAPARPSNWQRCRC
jgi:histidine transport system substrate-binding protein